MVIEHKKLPSPDYYRYASGNWDTPASRTPASIGPKKAEYDPAERFPGREFPVTVKKIKKKAEGARLPVRRRAFVPVTVRRIGKRDGEQPEEE